jgi:hypothetical protein
MLPAATFDAHDAAARIGLPPLAADGEALLQSIHAAAVQVWTNNALAPISLLITLVDDAAVRAVNSYPGDPAVPMNCTSGQIETSMGVMRGKPRALAVMRAQHLAQFVLGATISSVDHMWAAGLTYPQQTVSFMHNGRMGREAAGMPAMPSGAQFNISCFIQDRGDAQGSIDCHGGHLPWQYSKGVLGLPNSAAVEALGVDPSWVRVAVSAAMAVSTSPVNAAT